MEGKITMRFKIGDKVKCVGTKHFNYTAGARDDDYGWGPSLITRFGIMTIIRMERDGTIWVNAKGEKGDYFFAKEDLCHYSATWKERLT